MTQTKLVNFKHEPRSGVSGPWKNIIDCDTLQGTNISHLGNSRVPAGRGYVTVRRRLFRVQRKIPKHAVTVWCFSSWLTAKNTSNYLLVSVFKKTVRQFGSFPQNFGVKIKKNVWHHHLDPKVLGHPYYSLVPHSIVGRPPLALHLEIRGVGCFSMEEWEVNEITF